MAGDTIITIISIWPIPPWEFCLYPFCPSLRTRIYILTCSPPQRCRFPSRPSSQGRLSLLQRQGSPHSPPCNYSNSACHKFSISGLASTRLTGSTSLSSHRRACKPLLRRHRRHLSRPCSHITCRKCRYRSLSSLRGGAEQLEGLLIRQDKHRDKRVRHRHERKEQQGTNRGLSQSRGSAKNERNSNGGTRRTTRDGLNKPEQ